MEKQTKSTGLVKQASVVHLAPARAVSSHARRAYETRYRGRYRFPKLLFSLDLFLSAVVLSLVAFDLSMLLDRWVSRPSGLELTFSAPPYRALADTPVMVQVKAIDGREHLGVRLKWTLPEWVEVAEAYPHLAADRSVYLDAVSPARPGVSRLVLRLKAVRGQVLPISFTATEYDPILFARSFSGSDKRGIAGSLARIWPAADFDLLAVGATVPIKIENSGAATATSLGLRAKGPAAAFADGSAELALGDLGPKETRFIEFRPGSGETGLELTAQAYTIDRWSLETKRTEAVESGLSAHLDQGTLVLDYRGEVPAQATIVDPAGGTSQRVELRARHGETSLPLGQAGGGAWRIYPVELTAAGKILAPRLAVQATTTLPITVTTKYFADSGDQLGIGPVPFRVGERTSFWVVVGIGPRDTKLKDIILRTRLGPGFEATGKFAAAAVGEFKNGQDGIEWSLPEFMPVPGGGKLGFEVATMPQVKPETENPVVVEELSVQATDATDGMDLSYSVKNIKVDFSKK